MKNHHLFLCLALLLAPAQAEEDYLLAPAPRQIAYQEVTCQLPPAFYLWVDTSGGEQLLSVAEDVREALKSTYGELTLSASKGSHTSVEVLVRPDRVSRA